MEATVRTRGLASMNHDTVSAQRILDHAKTAGRSSLTAPEARGLCEAYGIKLPAEGVATTAEGAASARRPASAIRWS